MSAPGFRHDHAGCIYLGSTFAAGPMPTADLYFCEQGGFPTVIARFSSDESDYTSGLALADHDEYLGAAKHLAQIRGLLPAT